jgi:hypothetical protein
VLASDGTPSVRLWFAGHGRESGAALAFGALVPEAANDSIGEAASLDGRAPVAWPFNPMFDRLQGFLSDHLSERQPAVLLLDPDRQLLYYRGADAALAHPTNLAVARNPATIPGI